MSNLISFKLLNRDSLLKVSELAKQLNPDIDLEEINRLQSQMFELPNYHCFGMFLDGELIGISNAWITIRIYSGKQLEVDNVVVDSKHQSKGYGEAFFNFIEDWAKKNDCKTIELNTYVQNSRSHKFYMNLGYSILGFHCWKKIS